MCISMVIGMNCLVLMEPYSISYNINVYGNVYTQHLSFIKWGLMGPPGGEK